MSILKEAIKKSITDQLDDVTTTPVSIRLPIAISNEIDELSLSLDRSRSFLIMEFIKAGVIEANALLEERSALTEEEKMQIIDNEVDDKGFLKRKAFLLNTNYNNDKSTHFDMIENQEAAAFCDGWKEYICKLSKGDEVFLYQSGVGIIASGIVDGDLEKSDQYGKPDDKFSKRLKDFKTGFKAISARRFKEITGGGTNFRLTMIELSSHQKHAISEEIKRITQN